MPDPLFETFLTSLGLNGLHQKRVPYISEKLDFWWSIQQKITSIGYFGASEDQTIRIRIQQPIPKLRILKIHNVLTNYSWQKNSSKQTNKLSVGIGFFVWFW